MVGLISVGGVRPPTWMRRTVLLFSTSKSKEVFIDLRRKRGGVTAPLNMGGDCAERVAHSVSWEPASRKG